MSWKDFLIQKLIWIILNHDFMYSEDSSFCPWIYNFAVYNLSRHNSFCPDIIYFVQTLYHLSRHYMICPEILTFVQTLLLSLTDISHTGGSWVFSSAGIGALLGTESKSASSTNLFLPHSWVAIESLAPPLSSFFLHKRNMIHDWWSFSLSGWQCRHWTRREEQWAVLKPEALN